eukprot:SAG11_NODE_20812_length_437_cov_1.559172_1_plen_58_part_00
MTIDKIKENKTKPQAEETNRHMTTSCITSYQDPIKTGTYPTYTDHGNNQELGVNKIG